MKTAKNLPNNFKDEGIIWLTWDIAERMLEKPLSTNPLLPEIHLIDNKDYANTSNFNTNEQNLGNYIYKQYTQFPNPKLTTFETDNHVAILMNKNNV